jgi:hypothetical protein
MHRWNTPLLLRLLLLQHLLLARSCSYPSCCTSSARNILPLCPARTHTWVCVGPHVASGMDTHERTRGIRERLEMVLIPLGLVKYWSAWRCSASHSPPGNTEATRRLRVGCNHVSARDPQPLSAHFHRAMLPCLAVPQGPTEALILRVEAGCQPQGSLVSFIKF